MLIVPGGNFVAMGEGIDDEGIAAVRDAVRGGLGYLGICAGAFLAGHFTAPYRGFDLTDGVQFGFYAPSPRGIRRAAIPITRPGAPTLDHYWEDGPQLAGWGEVVARYPDGAPAIAQGTSGRGWVVLTGVHTEAPETWREGLTFTTPASTNRAYAAGLVRAALDRTRLPTF